MSPIQSPLSPQRLMNGAQGFDPTRDSGYHSPHANNGLEVRTDVNGARSRTPSPKVPVSSVRSYDQISPIGFGLPSDPRTIPRRRPVGSPTAMPMPPPQLHQQHHQHQQQHQYQPQMATHEMGEEHRPSYGAAILQPGWGSSGDAYESVSPLGRGIPIEHEYAPMCSLPRGADLGHGCGSVPVSPRSRHQGP